MKTIELTEDQLKSLVKLVDQERERNIIAQDDAYNTHWANLKIALEEL